MRCLVRNSIAIPLVALLFAAIVRAEDLTVVIHPATGITPDDFKVEKKNESHWADLKVLTTSKPNLLVGKSAADAPGGRCFVVELEDPRTVTITHLRMGGTNGVKGEVSYKEIVAVQPLSLWHRASRAGETQFLGRSFVWGSEKALHAKYLDSTTGIFEVTNDTPTQLTTKAVRQALPDIPPLFSHAVAEKLLPLPIKPNFNPETILDWARRFPVRGQGPLVMKNGGYEYDITPLKPPPRSSLLRLSTRPSRVVKADDGGVLVEVDLHNRMPVRASGMLRRDGGKPEGELELSLRKKGIGDFTKSRGAKFNLAPDEKQTAKFVVPKEFSSDPAFFKNNEVYVDLTGLGEIAERNLAEQRARDKAKAKKAKKK